MKKLSLDAVGHEQLERAKDASSGRSSSTVFGGMSRFCTRPWSHSEKGHR
jgi:hypothetical protein